MPGWKTPVETDAGDRPSELSRSTVELFLLGWGKAPIAPLGEPGRWQLALLTADERRELYRRHRPWVLAEAARRGLSRPWAERHL